MKARLLRISTTLILLLFLTWLIGEVFQDRYWLTGVLFFLPSPFVAAVLILSGILARKLQHPKLSRLFFTLSILPLLFVLFIENDFFKKKPEAPFDTLTLVHWNVWWDTMGPNNQARKIQSIDADLFALSEAPDQLDNLQNFHSLRRGPFLFLSKYPISHLKAISRKPLTANLLQWETPHGDLTILMADLPSGLQFHRHPLLTDLVNQLEPNKVDILVGDFNSPRRSLALQTLPKGYTHAYNSVGSCLSYTYPPFLPILSLDQCIHGPNIYPLRYDLQSTFLSDHKMQVFEFTVKDR